MMKTLLITATLAVIAAPALAQVTSAPPAGGQPPADDKFTKADSDKNGALSIAEVKLADATVTQADFDKADTDKSKSLSKAEFEKWSMGKQSDKGSSPGQ